MDDYQKYSSNIFPLLFSMSQINPSRIAYLIIAHHQPEHLSRLVQQLQHSQDHFFIYIDKRADIRNFQKTISGNINIHWIEKRLPIYWVGIGTVQAEIELLESAYKFGVFSQYIVLSGSDYPIKPISYIRSFIINEGRIFIPVQGCIYPTKNERFQNRYDQYHFLDNDFLNPRGRHANRFPFYHIRKFIATYPIRRNIPKNIKLYQGPTWVGMPQNFVEYLLNKIDIKKHISFYKNMYCPDEMFLPTIAKSSPLHNNLYFDFEKNTEGLNWLGLFYTDWHTPNIVLPKILDLSDLNAIKSSHPHALFARKFDQNRSAELLAAIDRTLLL